MEICVVDQEEGDNWKNTKHGELRSPGSTIRSVSTLEGKLIVVLSSQWRLSETNTLVGVWWVLCGGSVGAFFLVSSLDHTKRCSSFVSVISTYIQFMYMDMYL